MVTVPPRLPCFNATLVPRLDRSRRSTSFTSALGLDFLLVAFFCPVYFLVSTSVWRTRAVQQLNGAEVRASSVDEHEWVLTAEGLETLYGAREVRRRA